MLAVPLPNVSLRAKKGAHVRAAICGDLKETKLTYPVA